MLNGNKIKDNILVIFFSNRNFPKSKKGIEFWTFINVHFRIFEKSLEKDPLHRDLLRKCSKNQKNYVFFCYDKKIIFLKNYLGVFYTIILRIVMDSNFTPKNAKKIICEYCDFRCSKNSDWKRHISTDKHKNRKNDSIGIQITPIIENMFKCECGKFYKYDSGYYRHKKKCTINNDINNSNNTLSDKELILMILKDNSDFKNMMLEQNKSMMELVKNGTHNTNTINSHNKTFNLQLFLNDTCKDAINLSDFVNQIKLSISDLEETGKLGYAEGISKVFIKNLNDIDYNMRPIHCSDSKRETLYIKDDNQWSKDDDQKSNLTKAIKQVANKNIKQISEWQKLNPDYSNPDSKINDKYMKIVLNSMSGSTKEEAEKNYEKIAKNIVKEVVIEKSS
jgi:hypothetical protein